MNIFKLETETELDNLISNKPYEGGGNYKDLKEYFAKVKGMIGEVVYMAPDEYLSKIPYQPRSQTSIDYMKKKIKSGEKLPMPYLDYSGPGRVSQEGRNRSYLAKELGIEKIPVLVVKNYKDDIQNIEINLLPHPEYKGNTERIKYVVGQILKHYPQLRHNTWISHGSTAWTTGGYISDGLFTARLITPKGSYEYDDIHKLRITDEQYYWIGWERLIQIAKQTIGGDTRTHMTDYQAKSFIELNGRHLK